MDDVKGILQSKTVWGALLAVAATVAQIAGWDVGDVGPLAEQIAVLAGAGIAIYGRIVAIKRIAK